MMNRISRTSSQSFKTKGAGAIMHQSAANKFMELSTSYRRRKDLEKEEGIHLPWYIIHPHDIRAQVWWLFILMTVLATMWFEPYCLGFCAYPGLFPLNSPDTIISIVLFSAYALDVCLNFVVAFYNDEGTLVYDLRDIATHYAKCGRLFLDLLTTIPFDWIVLEAMGLQDSASTTAFYISLLRLLRLGRAYRLRRWVQFLSNYQAVSLMFITLVRNGIVAFYVIHWAACIFYYIARQSGFAALTWVGANEAWIGSAGTFDRYVYAMYWSIITFATVGYGDFHAYSVAEAVFVFVYVFINIGVGAYLIGTMTLLVTKADEETGRYRDGMTSLEQYTATHDIPKDLKAAMKGHMRLHFSAGQASDERVLGTYPTTIRRRILRHLYLHPLQQCWLLVGCKQKFLDALLSTAKMELLMPRVELVAEGDYVNEIYLLLAGSCCLERPAPRGRLGSPEEVVLNMEGAGFESVHGGTETILEPGDPLAEMAFFTETPARQAVRTLEVCRILSLPRTAYLSLCSAFPLSAKILLDNLLRRAQQMVEDEFMGPAAVTQAVAALDAQPGLYFKFASPESDNTSNWQQPPSTTSPGSGGPPLTQRKQEVLANLVRVRGLAMAQRDQLLQTRTAEFLTAASKGNIDKIKIMLQQGHDVSSADYDGRDALMLAAASGQVEVVEMLLAAGANPSNSDHLGGSALLEAAKAGHDDVLDALVTTGGKLRMTGVTAAAHLCVCVFEGDVRLLRRLLRCGIDANASDYDGRTATHIAAADGNLTALKVLMEGGASLTVKDRWGATPLDEARRVGATAVVEYLAEAAGPAEAEASLRRVNARRTEQLLCACTAGSEAEVQLLLSRGCPPNSCDYDARTGLMLASANGHLPIVRILVRAGANPNLRDNFGISAVHEAAKAGHSDIVAALVAAGGRLQMGSASALASELCDLVKTSQEQLLRSYLAAGADPNVADYDLRTPLHIAAAEGNLDMLRILVEAGGDPGRRDRWGASALDEAKRTGGKAAADFLAGAVRK